MSAAFELEIPIRFGDCDSAGIVFYPRYAEMLNRLVETWFEGPLGVSFRTLHQGRRLAVPTVRLEIDFRKASRLEDRLTFGLRVARVGGASCALDVEAACDGEVRLAARKTIVLVDLETFQPRPWPADLRAGLERHLATDNDPETA